ncbi:MAG: hypothetical protein NC218_01915 [Acetobacter sp.]|nr:hypothetical protein [Acetobacter sp.]
MIDHLSSSTIVLDTSSNIVGMFGDWLRQKNESRFPNGLEVASLVEVDKIILGYLAEDLVELSKVSQEFRESKIRARLHAAERDKDCLFVAATKDGAFFVSDAKIRTRNRIDALFKYGDIVSVFIVNKKQLVKELLEVNEVDMLLELPHVVLYSQEKEMDYCE